MKASGKPIPAPVGTIIRDVSNVGKDAKPNPGPKYYGMTWNSEEFKPVEIETCWQQHERARTPSDWIVAYQSCMNVKTMQDYNNSTPITVG
jgi:hypothetical protein